MRITDLSGEILPLYYSTENQKNPRMYTAIKTEWD